MHVSHADIHSRTAGFQVRKDHAKHGRRKRTQELFVDILVFNKGTTSPQWFRSIHAQITQRQIQHSFRIKEYFILVKEMLHSPIRV